jgi:hypothetical protein
MPIKKQRSCDTMQPSPRKKVVRSRPALSTLAGSETMMDDADDEVGISFRSSDGDGDYDESSSTSPRLQEQVVFAEEEGEEDEDAIAAVRDHWLRLAEAGFARFGEGDAMDPLSIGAIDVGTATLAATTPDDIATVIEETRRAVSLPETTNSPLAYGATDEENEQLLALIAVGASLADAGATQVAEYWLQRISPLFWSRRRIGGVWGNLLIEETAKANEARRLYGVDATLAGHTVSTARELEEQWALHDQEALALTEGVCAMVKGGESALNAVAQGVPVTAETLPSLTDAREAASAVAAVSRVCLWLNQIEWEARVAARAARLAFRRLAHGPTSVSGAGGLDGEPDPRMSTDGLPRTAVDQSGSPEPMDEAVDEGMEDDETIRRGAEAAAARAAARASFDDPEIEVPACNDSDGGNGDSDDGASGPPPTPPRSESIIAAAGWTGPRTQVPEVPDSLGRSADHLFASVTPCVVPSALEILRVTAEVAATASGALAKQGRAAYELVLGRGPNVLTDDARALLEACRAGADASVLDARNASLLLGNLWSLPDVPEGSSDAVVQPATLAKLREAAAAEHRVLTFGRQVRPPKTLRASFACAFGILRVAQYQFAEGKRLLGAAGLAPLQGNAAHGKTPALVATAKLTDSLLERNDGKQVKEAPKRVRPRAYLWMLATRILAATGLRRCAEAKAELGDNGGASADADAAFYAVAALAPDYFDRVPLHTLTKSLLPPDELAAALDTETGPVSPGTGGASSSSGATHGTGPSSPLVLDLDPRNAAAVGDTSSAEVALPQPPLSTWQPDDERVTSAEAVAKLEDVNERFFSRSSLAATDASIRLLALLEYWEQATPADQDDGMGSRRPPGRLPPTSSLPGAMKDRQTVLREFCAAALGADEVEDAEEDFNRVGMDEAELSDSKAAADVRQMERAALTTDAGGPLFWSLPIVEPCTLPQASVFARIQLALVRTRAAVQAQTELALRPQDTVTNYERGTNLGRFDGSAVEAMCSLHGVRTLMRKLTCVSRYTLAQLTDELLADRRRPALMQWSLARATSLGLLPALQEATLYSWFELKAGNPVRAVEMAETNARNALAMLGQAHSLSIDAVQQLANCHAAMVFRLPPPHPDAKDFVRKLIMRGRHARTAREAARRASDARVAVAGVRDGRAMWLAELWEELDDECDMIEDTLLQYDEGSVNLSKRPWRLLRKCDGTHCSKVESKPHAWQRCASCSGPSYCSRTCQSRSWPSHRSQCRNAIGS